MSDFDSKSLGEKLGEELKGKLDLAAKAIEEKNEGRVNDLKSEIDTLSKKWKEEVEKMPEMQKQLDNISSKLATAEKELGNKAGATSKTAAQILKDSFDEDRKLFEQHQAHGTGLGTKSYELKAVADMTFASNVTQTAAAVVDRQYIPGIFDNVRRRERIRQFIPFGTMIGDKVVYRKESGTGEGTVVTVDGAGSKPQLDKDIITAVAPAVKIAAYSKISEEMLTDLDFVSSFVTFQMTEDVYDKEDQQLLYGTGGTGPQQIEGLSVASGVLTAANLPSGLTLSNVDHKIDAIIAAAATLAASNYVADTILVHPVDMYDIMLLKDTADGQYLNRINFTTDGRLVIAGLVVGQSTAITQGQFLVANMARAAQGFQRAGLSVRFYDQNEDDAIKNLVTIVIEERLALAIGRPSGIFYDAYADVTAAT